MRKDLLLVEQVLITMLFPFVVLLAIGARIWTEIRSIPGFVWRDVCGEWQSLRGIWKEKRKGK